MNKCIKCGLTLDQTVIYQFNGQGFCSRNCRDAQYRSITGGDPIYIDGKPIETTDFLDGGTYESKYHELEKMLQAVCKELEYIKHNLNHIPGLPEWWAENKPLDNSEED